MNLFKAQFPHLNKRRGGNYLVELLSGLNIVCPPQMMAIIPSPLIVMSIIVSYSGHNRVMSGMCMCSA